MNTIPDPAPTARLLRPALALLASFTVLVGLVYPLVVTVAARVLAPDAARGSLLFRDGQVVGSRLIGQQFSTPGYFWSRPSATAPIAYNAAASGASNLGPTNPRLADAVAARAKAVGGTPQRPPPVDSVTASASGLDPHISPAAAHFQVDRVAAARGLPASVVSELVARHTEPRWLGLFGAPRVNVVVLNLALDALAQRAKP